MKVHENMSLRWLHQKATSQQHHVEVQARGCLIPWDANCHPRRPRSSWKTGRGPRWALGHLISALPRAMQVNLHWKPNVCNRLANLYARFAQGSDSLDAHHVSVDDSKFSLCHSARHLRIIAVIPN
ncbi:hypothetical protein ACN38_g11016 [Penicillium nordicum]|uniref:Uncharacterized protein n=1 Tax=Penicillium nordicum TaxID=229535 RepID=A0A0N0RXP3_9EURO|nr:hypothetical protein ACN38_g11016 [Penicillium nordicum]